MGRLKKYESYYSAHYRRNRNRLRLRWKKKRDDIILKAKKSLGNKCLDCGCKDLRVLEFDHVRGKKKFCIGHTGWRKWSETKKELRKCELVCCNCHRLRTLSRLPVIVDNGPPARPYGGRGRVKKITANGLTKTRKEWAALTGMPLGTIEQRLSSGWNHRDTVSIPYLGRGGRKPGKKK